MVMFFSWKKYFQGQREKERKKEVDGLVFHFKKRRKKINIHDLKNEYLWFLVLVVNWRRIGLKLKVEIFEMFKVFVELIKLEMVQFIKIVWNGRRRTEKITWSIDILNFCLRLISVFWDFVKGNK